jgi:hypothetical protein
LLSLVNVEQFYGIEIEEFPARIAETAMWLVDHQMNLELSEEVNVQRASLPLIHSAYILNDNALKVDWGEFTPKSEIDYILGNPPFKRGEEKAQEETVRKLPPSLKLR